MKVTETNSCGPGHVAIHTVQYSKQHSFVNVYMQICFILPTHQHISSQQTNKTVMFNSVGVDWMAGGIWLMFQNSALSSASFICHILVTELLFLHKTQTWRRSHFEKRKRPKVLSHKSKLNYQISKNLQKQKFSHWLKPVWLTPFQHQRRCFAECLNCSLFSIGWKWKGGSQAPQRAKSTIKAFLSRWIV